VRTSPEFRYGSAGARDISRAGVEQRLDKSRSSAERSTKGTPSVGHSPKIRRPALDAVKTLKMIDYSPVRAEAQICMM
jgi:hypothetical protein